MGTARAFMETTTWADNSGVNHTYLLDGDRMLAYIRHGTTEPFWFTKPITISKSGRKFELVEPNPFDTISSALGIQPTNDVDLVEIQGSKGDIYYLNKTDKTCTCPGFTFRGTCKHVKELESADEEVK